MTQRQVDGFPLHIDIGEAGSSTSYVGLFGF